jgi:hypothetical protein
MARRRTFTDLVVRRIPRLVDQGLSAAEIAEIIGCTVGTLRVRCSQFGISLRRKSPHDLAKSHSASKESAPACSKLSSVAEGIQSPLPRVEGKSELTVVISKEAAERLKEQASLKRMSYQALATCVLEIVARDRLYDAVLDDHEDEAPRPWAAKVP